MHADATGHRTTTRDLREIHAAEKIAIPLITTAAVLNAAVR
jgi:hypothetical protein